MITVDIELKFNRKLVDELLARVQAAGSKGLKAGIFDDPEVAFIAACHEFGVPTKGLAARSFMRSTMHENNKKYSALLITTLTAWSRGELSLDDALDKLGFVITTDMQEKITKGIPPPLKDKTVKSKQRKGSARPHTPLRDTDRLFNSINAKILRRG